MMISYVTSNESQLCTSYNYVRLYQNLLRNYSIFSKNSLELGMILLSVCSQLVRHLMSSFCLLTQCFFFKLLNYSLGQLMICTSIIPVFFSIYNLRQRMLLNVSVLLLLLTLSLESQYYTIDLDNPIIPSPTSESIEEVMIDELGGVWISSRTPSLIRYSSDFTSSQDTGATTLVNKLYSKLTNQTVTLNNGTTFLINSHIASMDYGGTGILAIQVSGWTWTALHTFGEAIMGQMVGGITIGATTHTYCLAVLSRQLKISYKGTVSRVAKVANEAGVAVDYARPTQQVVISTGDLLVVAIQFICSLTNGEVYSVGSRLLFAFDHGTNSYNYANKINAITQLSGTSGVIFSQKIGNFLYYQTVVTAAHAIFSLPDSYTNMDPKIPNSPTSGFFYRDGYYYLLQQTSLAQMRYQQTTDTMVYVNQSATFPSNNYQFTNGTKYDLAYIPGSPQVYKFQLVTHPQPLSVFSHTETISFFEFLRQQLETVASVPAGRRVVSPYFYFFGVFDDLFLHQFYDRIYGRTMTTLFDNINQVEYKKWSAINYKSVLRMLSANITAYEELTEYQSQYQVYQWQTFNHADVGTQSLMANCHNFFLVVVPIVAMSFIALRLVFVMTFNRPISKIWRKFDFTAFLFIMLFDGNFQQFSFYMSSEWIHPFAFTLGQRIVKVFILFFGFIVVLGGAGFYFICYSFYGRLNRILMDNNRNRLIGQALLICQIGLRNLILGYVASFMRGNSYFLALTVTICTDVLLLGIFIASLTSKVYKEQLKMWIYVWLSFVKILLVSTLYFDYGAINTAEVEHTQQFLLLGMLSIYLFGVAVEGVICVNDTIELAQGVLCRQGLIQDKSNEEKVINCYQDQRREGQNKLIHHLRQIQTEQVKQFRQHVHTTTKEESTNSEKDASGDLFHLHQKSKRFESTNKIKARKQVSYDIENPIQNRREKHSGKKANKKR